MCGERIHLIGSISLSSPPVAGVWWAHTLDWPPPVAGVWWAHTLDWLYLSLISTCSWCVVSAYTWLALWVSLISTCSWCVVSAYTWLALSISLSSPPVAGVWWAHCGSLVVLWQPSHHPNGCCTLVVVEERSPPTWLQSALGVQQYTIKHYINAPFIHSFKRC